MAVARIHTVELRSTVAPCAESDVLKTKLSISNLWRHTLHHQ